MHIVHSSQVAISVLMHVVVSVSIVVVIGQIDVRVVLSGMVLLQVLAGFIDHLLILDGVASMRSRVLIIIAIRIREGIATHFKL